MSVLDEIKLWLILLGTYEILTDFAGGNSEDVHNDNVYIFNDNGKM